MSAKSILLSIILTALLLVALSVNPAKALNPSYSSNAQIDTVPFYAGGTYNQSIPKPNDYLAHPIGDWPLRYYELVPYLKAVAAASDRVKLEIHGQTHEGRDLYNLFISTPENINKLNEYRQTMDKIAEPRTALAASELDKLIADQPAFVWLGHSIHGDEISGVDAAAQLIYQLAAGTDEKTLNLLKNLIVIIDPIENPDGRERYLSMLQSNKSFVNNYDPRALQHSGVWPWGRGNHYNFDLNRDWILQTQPETKGRTETMVKYKPVMMVDAHEMGSDATFLFSPPRQPINYNIPGNVLKWYKTFSEHQAAAFDQRGWPYYTGEWNDQWYPGYASAWPTFTGTVGILYEQAGVDGNAVIQSNDYLLTYHEAVNHHFTSNIANLTVAATNREALLRDYRQARTEIVDKGKKNKLSFLIAPDPDELKMNRFLQALLIQGIEVHKATQNFEVASTTDIYGKTESSKKLPAGTYIIKTDQPSGALAKAVLEFDPHLSLKFLKSERKELEKYGETRMYEISSWSLPLAFDLDAYQTTSNLTVATEPVTITSSSSGRLINGEAAFGFLINMVGEKTYQALNRIFEKELTVYAAEKEFTIEGRNYNAGTLLLRKRGNKDNLNTTMADIASQVGLDVIGVNTGLSTEGSHLGAPTFHLLAQPKVAILSGDGVSTTDYASLWFTVDRELEIPHSLITVGSIQYGSIDKYNVIIIPRSWGGAVAARLGEQGTRQLDKWVSAGGTLITSGTSSYWAADSSSGLSNARLRRQSLEKLAEFDLTVSRQRNAEAPMVDTMEMFHPEKIAAKAANTKESEKEKATELKGKELEEMESWERRFMPQGVILRANLDKEDWLSFGMKAQVPVFFSSRDILLTDGSVTTTARFADENSLRLSGMLWPEARKKIANSAYVTHESKGKGQIILFAGSPNLRAYFYGTRKMFVNAVLYGPGMGARVEDY